MRIYIIDCKNEQVYFYEPIFEEDKYIGMDKYYIQLGKIEFSLLKILANGHCYSLKELSILLDKKKFALYFYRAECHGWEHIRYAILDLRKKGFKITTVSKSGYRLEDIIYIK